MFATSKSFSYLLAAAMAVAGGLLSAGEPTPQKPGGVEVRLDTGATLSIQAPIAYRNLAVYPILRKGSSPRSGEYLTLDEGLKLGVVEVREIGGAAPPPLVRPRPPLEDSNQREPVQQQRLGVPQASVQGGSAEVNRLLVLNRSDRKLLLISGEMVVGGKQDRIVQKDRIIPPSDKPQPIDVFCVEAGRWQGNADVFAPAAITSPGGGAGGFGGGGGIADPAIRGAAQSKGEQQSVWDEVGKKNSKLGAAPGATTYQAARLSVAKREEDKGYWTELGPKMPRDAVGAIVAINGKLVWLDEFSTPSLFHLYWPKLLRSYALEAVAARPAPDMEARIKWRLPTPEEAAAYRVDRAGTAKFEGEEGIFKLVRIESKAHVIYELSDLTRKDQSLLHVCKMERR